MNTEETIDLIVNKIMNGKSLHITVSGMEDDAFRAWITRLGEFKRSYGGKNSHIIICNSMTPRETGKERLEIDIDNIPEEAERQRLGEIVRTMYAKDHPKIALR